jgi:hypothetical protein
VRTELTEKFKDFIARACWKMGDTLPYCDTFLEDASALVPTDFEYAKWLRIGKRFERVMIGKYHNFTQEVDSYEKKLDTIKNLYLSILKKPQNQGVVELYQNEDMKLNYPILSNLAGTVLALPHSSVEVERLFSQLKLIKSERRCNLSEVTLESLLLLKTTDVSIVEDAKIYQSIVDKQISMRAKLAELKKESSQRSKRKIEELQNVGVEVIKEENASEFESFEDMLDNRLKKMKLEKEEKNQSKIRHRIFDDEFYL